MRDLKIKVGGPRDMARQDVKINVHEGGPPKQVNVAELLKAVEELKAAIVKDVADESERRRLERELSTLQEEAGAEAPRGDEIKSAVDSVTRILSRVGVVSAAVTSLFNRVKMLVGL